MDTYILGDSYMKFIVFAFLVFNISLVSANEAQKAADAYLAAGKKILEQINSNKADATSAEALIEEMTVQSLKVIDIYITKNPASKQLLTYLKNNVPKMKTESFSNLEKDWHDAGKLTKDVVGMDLKDEDNEKYLDPCHILIHPMMVRAALKTKDLASAKEELTEGMEQMSLSVNQVK